jgi:kynurenine formamidase
MGNIFRPLWHRFNRRKLLTGGLTGGLTLIAASARANLPQSAWNVVRDRWQSSQFGANDQIGAANLLTSDTVRRSLAIPQSGRVISLGLPLDEDAPGFPPRKFAHYLIQNIGTDESNHDDFVDASLNVGTQIDGLAHLGVNGVFYNGNRAEDFVAMEGLKKLGSEHIPPMVTRGMLLDLVALKGRQMKGGEVITVKDIETALKNQQLPTPERSDIVLLHTGWMDHWRAGEDIYWQQEPGLGIEAARWLAERGIVAVGNDTSRLEADPFEEEGLFFPVHQILLAENGVYILENINTQALIDANATNFPFLLIIAPLPITGASQTWINPLAVI